ncbi:ABC-type Zn uptake system ZnuABC Zn-binding protein ZnuA [Oxalobacteraceae bacterium GrIS 2.11]
MLGSQVKRLLTGVSDHGRQHLLEVETDLVQTAFLLGEAVEKLGSSFFALHGAVSAQQREVEILLAGMAEDDPKMHRLRELRDEIAQHTNEAVTGLQFQDLTSQLLARTVQRIIGLRNVLSELAMEGSGMPTEGPEDEIVLMLNEINKNLDVQSSELKDVLRKAVHQKDMDSGDIEMF